LFGDTRIASREFERGESLLMLAYAFGEEHARRNHVLPNFEAPPSNDAKWMDPVILYVATVNQWNYPVSSFERAEPIPLTVGKQLRCRARSRKPLQPL
jgi:hypothetical protein